MKYQELVSIIMPLYNCEDYVSESVETVIKQNYKQWELIVIDDKSTDSSLDIIRKIQKYDKRIKLIKSNENEGPGKSKNKGMEIAIGKYVAFLDSDDLWEKNKLVEQINFMNKNNADFSFTSFKRIYIGGKVRYFKVPRKITYFSILIKNSICNSSVMIDITKIGKVYFPDIRKREDYALWLNILKAKTKYGYGLNKCLTMRNVREESESSNRIELIKYHWELYRKYENFSVIISSLLVAKDIIIKLFRIK
jgi:teichuronic acid biosynthesis glycosyltransferase TuaG